MTGTMTIIQADGSIATAPLDAEQVKRVPQFLDRLQGLLGGYIETVPYFNRYEGRPCVAFCNEEGKLARPAPLPTNMLASMMWWGQHKTGDALAGTVVIVTGAEVLAALSSDE